MSNPVEIDRPSERYRLLVESVIARLPDDWNIAPGLPPKRVIFVEKDELPERPFGLAVTEFRADGPYRRYHTVVLRTVVLHTVVLYSRNLAECPDDVVRWAIAHKLGHVISSHLLRYVADKEKHEDIADSLAMGWGFAEEWKAWDAWNEAALAKGHQPVGRPAAETDADARRPGKMKTP